MKILNRYVLKELVAPFVVGLFLFTFILIMSQIFQLVELIVNKGANPLTVLKLFTCILPSTMTITIPMAILMASLASFSRLSADSEIIAIKANGISLYKLIAPVIIVGFIFSLFSFYFNDALVPQARYTFKRIYYDLLQRRATVGIQERVFITDFEGMILYVESIDKEGPLLRDITLYRLEGKKLIHTIFAKRGVIVFNPQEMLVSLKLMEGTIHDLLPGGPDRYSRLNFHTCYLNLDISSSLRKGEGIYKGPAEMTIKEIQEEIARRRGSGLDVARYLVRLQEKIALPFSCLAVTLLGIPLGLRTKHQKRSVSFGISIVITFIYYLLFIGGRAIGERGLLPPFLAMWTTNFIFAIIGLKMISGVLKRD